uniref:NADH-ubiquinone oxidoreductase chain 5 n=1 Tax=Phelsuma guimbeaui TaxID=232314 RepID=A0A0A1H9V2_9SAUR|nr:NADH dehydrogenase subunit 5 [Phelsuma guimbeaui]
MIQLFHTSLMGLALMLLLSMLLPRSTNKEMTTTLKYLTMLSLIPTTMFINFGMETTMISTNWVTTHMTLKMSFTLDKYSTLFLPIALFITWAIMEFSNWYMADDPNISKFSKYLMLFLTAMLTLTTANNMLQLFIGWEGVGIMSFLLISWWSARNNANASALQAVIYNRTGDIGLILFLAWSAMNLNTWEMQLVNSMQSPILPLMGLILAAMGKSAQFGLHPWLPSAMEGPTPVSALLHSSTMVVAGIFMLVRLYPLMQKNDFILTTCLCLGGLTTVYAALAAITQNDIKKIIAFSTTSQLGLMMLTIGMKQPDLAFMHITTHAFFKAMLFLCSGSIIHALNNEQDIRKMGGLQKTMPITTSCLTLGNLALAGTPFLTGFYSKDTIIETMNTSTLNAWALLMTLFATMLTAAYSIRLTFYTQLHYPRTPPLNMPKEQNTHQTHPIIRLAVGSIIAGLIISTLMLPDKPQTMTMPLEIKLSATLVTLLGLVCSWDLIYQTTKLTKPLEPKIITPLNQLAFFNLLIHRILPKKSMNHASKISMQLNDLLWYEKLGPTMLQMWMTLTSNTLARSHLGNVKTLLMMFPLLLMTTVLFYKL